MTRPFNRHLDSDELDALVSSPNVTESGHLSEQVIGEARHHVESCPDCHRKVQMRKSVQNGMGWRSPHGTTQPGPDCVEESRWIEVAAGLMPESQARKLMEHAAQCDHCGPQLRTATEVLTDEATPSEETLIDGLHSSGRAWQDRISDALRASGGPPKTELPPTRLVRFFSWPRPAFAAIALALLVLGTWIGVKLLRPPSAEDLLAQAYTERRTLEVRIPGASYAPMRLERGPNQSNLDKPASLLKAEALIGESLRKDPDDPFWLEVRGRADLLDGDYDSAIRSLERAKQLQPGSARLKTDLGSAYFLRAEAANQKVDYANAIESYSQALERSPDEPVGLFNRALAYDRLSMISEAVKDWEHYLRVDPEGDWADEARAHLAAVKQKREQRLKSLQRPLLTPEEIVARASDPVVRDEVESRIEEYLKLAVLEWLPNAFAESSAGHPNGSQAALKFLATIAYHKHEDLWLSDLLATSGGPDFQRAVRALADAVGANERGDYATGRDAAQHAALLFVAEGNLAGRVRAQAEEVYSTHLLWEGERCLSLVDGFVGQLTQKSYTFLRAQVQLEEAICADLVGDLGHYQRAVAEGTELAAKHHYTALELRGLGFQSLAASSLGDVNRAFSLASDGLGLFWSGRADLMKGYNLYTDLDAAADILRLPHFQVAVWREATELIDHHPDVVLRAMAHRWYGNAAYLAYLPSLAESEFSVASALFAASPQTEATMRYRMDAEIWLAQIEARQGDLDQALARLHDIEPVLRSTPSFGPEIGFYSAQAEIGIRRGDPAAAEAALRPAIFLAEWALNSFPSEGDRRRWAEQTNGAYRNAVEWKLREGDALSALELWEWYKGAELRAAENRPRASDGHLDSKAPPDPRSAPILLIPTVVANRLPLLKNETVVTYAIFNDGIGVWASDDDGLLMRWITASPFQLQETAIRFQRLCADPRSDLSDLKSVGRSLYDMLIAPVESKIANGRRLRIEPDGFLNGVPWDALVDPRGHYLVERAAISILPGFYRSMRLKPIVPISAEDRALIVAVSSASGENLPPLADVVGEAQVVASKFASAQTLEDRDATLSAVREGMRGAMVFHFSGHAFSSPSRSGLVLSELDPNSRRSRLLNAASFSPREMSHLQLAVLSACNTVGLVQPGVSGSEGLTQALLNAGVPDVVASRWNVDSSATSEFMQQFYARLLAGKDAADSLRAAELNLASRRASSHPYFWAPFQLSGN